MKLPALLLPLILLSAACSSDPYGNSYGQGEGVGSNTPAVPGEVINALPKRILNARLQPQTNPYEYINQLGLGQWADNLSHQEKFDSYFLALSRRHVLQIQCSRESLTITERDAQAIQAGQVLSSSPQWLKDPVVVGAILRLDWNQIIVQKTY